MSGRRDIYQKPPDTGRFVRRLKEMGIFEQVARLIRPRRVSVEALISRDRHKSVSTARHEIMYWIRTKLKYADGTPWSYPEIGKLFERDHTTVMQAYRKVLATNPNFGASEYPQGSDDPYDISEWIVRF